MRLAGAGASGYELDLHGLSPPGALAAVLCCLANLARSPSPTALPALAIVTGRGVHSPSSGDGIEYSVVRSGVVGFLRREAGVAVSYRPWNKGRVLVRPGCLHTWLGGGGYEQMMDRLRSKAYAKVAGGSRWEWTHTGS